MQGSSFSFSVNRINKWWECCGSKGCAKPQQRPPSVNLKSRFSVLLWKVQGKYKFFPEKGVFQSFSEMQVTWISPPCTAPCTQSGVSSPFKSPICREADTSPFGFLPHNQSGWINMEVVNIYSQNTGSFVPINMCSVSALGTGFTQQSRHESHCSQQSAVSYYLQHRVDCCCCDCEFHPLSSPETHHYTALRAINAVISISIASHTLHFGTQH